MITPEDENAHAPGGPGWGEATTFGFGDSIRGLYGSVRLGATSEDSSTLALLFASGDLAASEVGAGADGRVQASVIEPLVSWRVSWDGAEGGVDLVFSALGEPLVFGPEDPAGAAAGLEGYEQLCRVEGTIRTGSTTHEISCLGQRGHQWGAPDWTRIRLARTLSAWLGEERGVALAAVRTSEKHGHAGEAVSAWLVSPGADGEEGPAVTRVDESRLSTAYDERGRQRRAGLELWPEPDSDFPRRIAGEAVCGTSLPLGRLRLDTAFFVWRMEGAEGVGRYDILRRADAE